MDLDPTRQLTILTWIWIQHGSPQYLHESGSNAPVHNTHTDLDPSTAAHNTYMDLDLDPTPQLTMLTMN